MNTPIIEPWRPTAISVTEVYGENFHPPSGYELTGEFRPAAGMELWLDQDTGTQVNNWATHGPRLILRKIQPRKRVFMEHSRFKVGEAVAGPCYYSFDYSDNKAIYFNSFGLMHPNHNGVRWTLQEEE
jgi:hypothetical protein